MFCWLSVSLLSYYAMRVKNLMQRYPYTTLLRQRRTTSGCSKSMYSNYYVTATDQGDIYDKKNQVKDILFKMKCHRIYIQMYKNICEFNKIHYNLLVYRQVEILTERQEFCDLRVSCLKTLHRINQAVVRIKTRAVTQPLLIDKLLRLLYSQPPRSPCILPLLLLSFKLAAHYSQLFARRAKGFDCVVLISK